MAQLQSGTRIHGNAIIDTTLDVRGTNPSTDTLSGAILIGGGAGVVGNINAGGNITGNYIIGNYLTGTLTTAAQPNITSTGTLSSLSVTGNVQGGNLRTTGLISAAGNVNSANLNTGNISASGNLYANNANFAGVVFAGGDVSTTGNISAENANFAGVVFAGGDVSTNGNVSAVNANFSGFVFAQGNVTSGGNFSTTGNIYANNANFGGFVFATGNITSDGNISTTGNLYANNANFSGWVFATGNITSGGNLSTTGNLYANNANFNGVVFAQGNITTNGNLSTAGNITANNANFNGVVFANGNISTNGNFYGGYTELSSLSVSGNITGGNLSTSGKLDAGDATITGNLTVHGTTIYADVTTVRVKDPIIEQGGNTTGAALTTDDGKDRGTILHYFTSTPVDAFMGWDNSNAEFALGSDITATNEVITFNSYGNLRVDRIIGNGALLTSITGANVTGQVANALVAGTVYGNVQSNITSVGTLTSLTVGSGGLNVQSTTESTATTNGAIKTAGGVGIAKNINVGGNATVETHMYVGPGASGTAFTNPTIIAKDTGANYIQAAVVNSNETGSADWVAYADNGTDSEGWADFGFTSSNFSDPTYTITGPSDGYFFVQSLLGSYGGNLVLATGDQGTTNDIIFGTGGFDVTNEFGRIIHGTQTFHIKSSTVSTTTSTGALRVDGGVGIASNLRVGSGIYGSSIISAAANVTGANLLTGGLISAAGNVTSGNLLTAGLISATGNITANYHIGNGALLTDITGASVTGTVANANYAAYAGQVVDASQSNITSLGTLTSVSVSGNANVGNLNTGGNVSATGNITSGNIITSGLASVTGNVQGGNLRTAGLVSATGNITGGNITTGGLVSITGNLDAGNLRTSGIISATGNITAGNVSATYFIGDGSQLSNLTIAAGSAITNGTSNIVVDPSANIRFSVAGVPNVAVVTTAGFQTGTGTGGNIYGANWVTANYYVGTLTTGAQPNITTVGTLTSLSVSGNVTAGNLKTDNLLYANGVAWSLGGGTAGNIANGTSNVNIPGSGSNVTVSVGGTSNVVVVTTTGANVTGTISASGNITGNYHVGNGSTLTDITGGNVTGQVANALVAGTVYTAAQPSITSVGTLTSLSVTGNANVGNLNTGGNVSATGNVTGNYILGNGSQLTNITAVTAGTVTTNAQPNITSIGTLTSLSVSGNANVGNLSTSGNVTGNYILGNGSQLTDVIATTAGTVTTNAQPNITSTGTLSSLSVSGNATIAGNLTVSGTAIYANVTSILVKDPIIEQGGNPNGTALSTDDGKDRGQLLHYYTTAPIDAFMGWDNSNAEFAFGSNVSVSGEVTTFNTLGNVRAGYFLGNGSQLTDVTATTAGTVTTNAQPNITSTGTLASLSVSGNANVGNLSTAGNVTANYFIGNGSTLTNLAGANVTGTVANANYATYAGTVTTAAQPNITSVGTLATLSVTGNANVGNINSTGTLNIGTGSGGNITGVDYITANFFSGNGSLLSSITGANVTGQVANALIAGTVYTNAQPNITSVGTLASLAVTANVQAGNLRTTGLLSASGNVTGSYIIGNGSTLTDITGSNVTGQVGNALVSGTVYTAAQPNITSVGTLTTVSVSGNANVGNLSTAGNVTGGYVLGNGSQLTDVAALTATTVTASAQPNITSTGTLASLSVIANANVGNLSTVGIISASGNITGNYILGNGSQLTGVTATTATTAATVTTNAQPNITSVGTLSSLSVSGNVTFSGANVNVGDIANLHIGGGTDGYILVTDGTGNLSWESSTPTTTIYTPNSLALTNGVYVSGGLSDIQAYNDGNSYILTDGTASGPAWIFTTDFISVTTFNRVVMNINYTASSGHTIYVQLYNYNSTTWDSIGTYTGLGTYYAFALQVIDDTNYISGGIVQLRLYHSNAGNAGHQSNIDYMALEQSTQGPQGPRGPTGATGATGAAGQGVATGGTTGQILIKNSSSNYDTAWASSLSLTGNITGANLYGNGYAITGLPLANLSDVSLDTPSQGQLLSYNGTNWVNINNTGSVSAGAGVDYWLSSPIIIARSANNDIQVDTLSTTPNTSAQTYANVTVNGTAVVAAFETGPLNRTIIDAGNWDFSFWANANTASGTATLNAGIHEVDPVTGGVTFTMTGTGTTRTVTASGGTPFASIVAGSDPILSSYIQSPLGMFRITAKTSDTEVSISTLTTYSNETSVSLSVWIPLFNVGSASINATLTEYLFGTTQTQFTLAGTDSALGLIIATTTSQNKIVSVTINGTNQASHFATPLHTLHDDLAGLQGGSANEYYHLTTTEYTGTGSGTFVRASSPTLTSPVLGAATGTSLSVTGNVTANYFIGNGSTLTNITGANVTGEVSYAATANSVAGSNVSGQVSNALVSGTVYTNAQPNITSVGILSSLSVTGNANVGNINATGSLNIGTGSGGNISSADYITANFFSGNGSLLSSITGANVTGQVAYAATANSVAGGNVSGQVGNALVAGTVYGNAQANITSVGTLTSLSVSGNVQGGNLRTTGIISASGNITGNYFIGDGSQLTNLTIGAGSAITNGTSNVTVDNNGNVRTSVGGTNNVVIVTGTGANVAGYVDVTGNLTVGNITSLGSNANVKITGGSNTNLLSTDGTGNLSWQPRASLSGTTDAFTGDNSTTTFTLSVTPASKHLTMVNIDGVLQLKADYTLTGAVIGISPAPATGVKIEVTTLAISW